MPEIRLNHAIPANDDDFDLLCSRLFSRHWSIPALTRNGRRGQAQNGVDFYGADHHGKLYGGQSKLHVHPATLTEQEVREEVDKAKTFSPPLAHFAIVTSSRRDTRLQKLEREIDLAHHAKQLFRLKIYFWDDVADLLQEYSDVRDAFFAGASASQVAEFKSLAQGILRQVEGKTLAGEPHAEIDDAVDSMRNGEWRLARTQLERMRQRKWQACGPSEKFRILANLGHSYEYEGDFSASGKLFLQAAAELPGDERAIMLSICGQLYLGNVDQARRLVSEFRDSHPENSDGHALYARTAPAETQFKEIEAAIPRHHRDEAGVALELSRRAYVASTLDVAEQYARVAFRKQPTDALILAELGAILITREIKQNQTNGRFVPTDATPDNLKEAIAKITEAINSPRNAANKAARIDLLLKRATAHDLLGNQTERHADIVQAFTTAPDHVECCLSYATLLDEQSRHDEAISLVERISADDPSGRPPLLLAQLLAVRNRPGDRVRAYEISRDTVPQAPGSVDRIGHVAEFMLRLSVATERLADFEATLNTALRARISATMYHVLAGSLRLAANDRDAAKACAAAGQQAVSPETPRFDRIQLGCLFHSLQEFESAAAVLREVVRPNVIDDDALRFLDAAQRSGEIELILQFCRGLRDAGVFDRQCINLELGVRYDLKCLKSAIQVIGDVMPRVRDDDFRRELIVRRSIIGIAVGDQLLVTTDLSELPAVERADAALGRMTTVLLSRGADPIKAVEYAYELVRRHFNNPEARMAVAASLGIFTAESRVTLPEHECVQIGSAVGYQTDDSDAVQWWIIEDSPDPKAEFRELAPEHLLAKELIGKRVGDEFFIRRNSVQDRTATISEIVPKYVYRLRECVASWEERYPDQFFVQQIQFKLGADGVPDLSPIFSSIDRRISQAETMDSFYRDQPISVFTLAEAYGATVITTMTHLVGQRELAVKCCDVSSRDLQALGKLRLAKTVLLDSTALATLFLSDTFEKLLPPNGLWAITEATHREIGQWRSELRESRIDGGFMTKIRGRHVLLQHDPSSHAPIVARFERFEAAIEHRVAVESGDDILRCEKSLRENLIRGFGPACAQSIVTAMRPGYLLWTDDLVAGYAASELAGCDRVWTQGVAGWLAESRQIERELYDNLALYLIESGYSYTLISPSIFVEGAHRSKWNSDDSPLRNCLKWFSNRTTRPETMFRLFVGTIKATWSDVAILQNVEAITVRLLDEIAQLSYGRAMIDELYRNSRLLFGLNVVAAEEFDRVIEGWDASGGGQGRIVLPSR